MSHVHRVAMLSMALVAWGTSRAGASIIVVLPAPTGVPGSLTLPVPANAADATYEAKSSTGTPVEAAVFFTVPQSLATSSTAAQSLDAAVSGTLSNIELLIGTSDGLPSTCNVALYDAGSATSNALIDTTVVSYKVDSSVAPGHVDGTNTIAVSGNLLTNGAGVVLPGEGSPTSNEVGVDLAFSGADAVSIKAGEEYVVEITAKGSNLHLYSDGASTYNYYGGTAFIGGNPLKVNSQSEDMAVGLAVSAAPAPEPTTLGVLAAGALLACSRRRRG